MPVMTRLVFALPVRRTAAVGGAAVHRVILRVLMLHKIALNLVKMSGRESSVRGALDAYVGIARKNMLKKLISLQ
jgi:hypothetical protein